MRTHGQTHTRTRTRAYTRTHEHARELLTRDCTPQGPQNFETGMRVGLHADAALSPFGPYTLLYVFPVF